MAKKGVKRTPREPNKGYKFRLYPDETQKVLFENHFGCVRFVFNQLLAKTQETYKNTKKYTSQFENNEEITKLKQQEEFSFLNDVNSQSLQYASKHLNTGYKNYFKYLKKKKQGIPAPKVGLPQFKKKHSSKQSFVIPAKFNIDFEKVLLYIPKLKTGIPIVLHREIKSKELVSCSISKTKSGKYFVSFQVEEKIEKKPEIKKTIGIDLGIKSLVYCSDGLDVENPRWLNTIEKRIKRVQRNLTRKQKGSKNRDKARLKLAKIYEKLTNQRNDFLQKLSTKIIHENQVICLETLNVSGMFKNHKLAKQIQNCGWSLFVGFLEYKAKWYGRTIKKINRFFPSSKICNDCGYKNQILSLKDREWICSGCGTCHLRDWNASKNIQEEGLKELSAEGYAVDIKQCLWRPKPLVFSQEENQVGSVKQKTFSGQLGEAPTL